MWLFDIIKYGKISNEIHNENSNRLILPADKLDFKLRCLLYSFLNKPNLLIHKFYP